MVLVLGNLLVLLVTLWFCSILQCFLDETDLTGGVLGDVWPAFGLSLEMASIGCSQKFLGVLSHSQMQRDEEPEKSLSTRRVS